MSATNRTATAPLPTRPLGRTGRDVTLFGLGGEGVLRTWNRTSEAVAVIQRALDQGVNYCDTAPAYASSMDYYGAALGERRAEVFLASKTADRTRDGSLRILDDSLRRLEKNPLRILDSKNPDMQPLIAEAPVMLEYLDAESAGHFEDLKGLLDAGEAFSLGGRIAPMADWRVEVLGTDISGRAIDAAAEGLYATAGLSSFRETPPALLTYFPEIPDGKAAPLAAPRQRIAPLSGAGLNLTWEVGDGIRAHSWKVDPPPATEEGMVCRFADRIAYLTHDVDDAVRAGVIDYADLPRRSRDTFGEPGSAWIDTMIEAVAAASARSGRVSMDPAILEAMNELRDFMFQRVYLRPEAEGQRREAVSVIRRLVDHFVANPDEVPDTYRHHTADPTTAAIDYVSGMTDRFALREYESLGQVPSLPLKGGVPERSEGEGGQ